MNQNARVIVLVGKVISPGRRKTFLYDQKESQA
jgi:hypothetical protein